jgi:Tape measure protein
MTEVERLVLEVESRGLSQVNRDLATMDKSVKSGEGSWKKMLGMLTAVYGAFKLAEGAVTKLISATRQYQDFNAALQVSTKSAEGAKIAYQAIEDFAAQTPYSVAEATTAFIRLTNLGLTPSERALRSYGNTASAMNKQLIDFIEAVADAATGEFERLKEFGIRASKLNDQVSFTFQGVTKTVAFNAGAIEEYLTKLGENNFAGSMEKRMAGLSGVMSNLEDSWDRLWVNISKEGPGNIITEAFKKATEAVDELNARLASGQLDAQLKAQGNLWTGYAEDIHTSMGIAATWVEDATIQFMKLFGSSDADIHEIFLHFPTYAKAAWQILVLDVYKFVKDFEAAFSRIGGIVKAEFDRVVTYGKAAFTYLHDIGTNPVYNIQGYKDAVSKYQQALSDANDAAAKAHEDVAAKYQGELNLNDNIVQSETDDIIADLKKRNDAYDEAQKKAADARAAYDKAQEERKNAGGDRLARFKVGGETTGPTPEQLAKQKKLDEQLLAMRLDSLEKGMVGENQVIAEGYEERKRAILENEALTQDQKKNLVLQALSQSIVSEDQAVRTAYEQRREFILSDTLLTEQAKTELMKNLEKNRQEELRKIEQAALEKRLDQASQFFGNIAAIGSTFGKRGFAIAKAAAIAQATIDTYKAATGAYASLASIPYVGPALGAAAAAAAIVAGTARIAQIKSQQYSGAYQYGGMIPAGKYGLVGEAGPEIVRGPAVVTSAAATAAKGTSGGVRTVTVHNYGAPVQAESRWDNDELMVVLKPLLEKNKQETKHEIAGEIDRGGGKVARSMERTYGVRRGQQ